MYLCSNCLVELSCELLSRLNLLANNNNLSEQTATGGSTWWWRSMRHHFYRWRLAIGTGRPPQPEWFYFFVNTDSSANIAPPGGEPSFYRSEPFMDLSECRNRTDDGKRLVVCQNVKTRAIKPESLRKVHSRKTQGFIECLLWGKEMDVKVEVMWQGSILPNRDRYLAQNRSNVIRGKGGTMGQ